MKTYWLIEVGSPGRVVYFSTDGDWCSNANHAEKFVTAVDANAKMQTMHLDLEKARVVQHAWTN